MDNYKYVDCIMIELDCVPAKYPYPECGNPKYEGFIFRVKPNKFEKMLKFALTTLDTYSVPVVAVHYQHSKTAKCFLDNEISIFSTIMKNVEYMLKRQAEAEQENTIKTVR